MLCNDRVKNNRDDRHASGARVLVLIKALGGPWYFLLSFSACSLVGAFMTTAPSAFGSCLKSGLTNVFRQCRMLTRDHLVASWEVGRRKRQVEQSFWELSPGESSPSSTNYPVVARL